MGTKLQLEVGEYLLFGLGYAFDYLFVFVDHNFLYQPGVVESDRTGFHADCFL